MTPFAENLIGVLKRNIPELKFESGGKEVSFRCRFCGDSRDPKGRHFYVSVPTEDKPALFNCFKCGMRGVLTPQVLAEIGITDSELNSGLGIFNKKVLSYSKNQKYQDLKVYNLINNFIADQELGMIKLKYINQRLGLNLSFQDCLDNKIILNLFDLFRCNPHLKYTRDPRIVKELNDSFLGFISVDNCFANMRKINDNPVNQAIDKRYINYVIYDKYNNTQKYYVPPVEINRSIPGRVKLHIAEGPFDILSIKYNCRKEINGNIYASIGGNTYLNTLLTFINSYGIINLEVHIYLDNDVYEDKLIKTLINTLSVYNIPIFIHHNIFPGEKDFGVDISRINESIIQIL